MLRKRQKIFKTILSLALVLLMVSSNMLGYLPSLVNAEGGVHTQVSNTVAQGVGSNAAASGNWTTNGTPCIWCNIYFRWKESNCTRF